jgi:hypothetical protein
MTRGRERGLRAKMATDSESKIELSEAARASIGLGQGAHFRPWPLRLGTAPMMLIIAGIRPFRNISHHSQISLGPPREALAHLRLRGELGSDPLDACILSSVRSPAPPGAGSYIT